MSFDPEGRRFVTKPIRVIDDGKFKCLKFGLYHKDTAKSLNHQVESLLIMTYSQISNASRDREPRGQQALIKRMSVDSMVDS